MSLKASYFLLFRFFEDGKVDLEINVQKTEQTQLNQSSVLLPSGHKGPTDQHSR